MGILIETLTAVGAATVIIIGISSWLGKVIAARIEIKEQEKINIKLEQIKSDISVLAQKNISQISNYSMRSSKAIEEVYCELIDLLRYFEIEFSKISAMWKQIRKDSLDKLDENTTHQDELRILKLTNEDITTEPQKRGILSREKYAVSSLEFIVNKGQDWADKFDDFKYSLMKKEIYIDKKLVEIVNETVKNINEIVSDTFQKSAQLGHKGATKGADIVDVKDIEAKAESIKKQFHELLEPTKELLVAEIVKQLTPISYDT